MPPPRTLKELHENRVDFAQALKSEVLASFNANGLTLEEVTIVTLEQTGKEFFKADNVFDAEGLKVITEITSDARRKVHETEKRTTVSIRQKDLDTQLELLEIERNEAVARAQQDKEVANEQAGQLSQKQVYVLDQRMAVEEREIENERTLERLRTERDLAVIEEARRREQSEIQKELALEQERRDREIALIAKRQEESLSEIVRSVALEKAEKDREIEIIAKTKEAELAEIARGAARERAEKERDIELAAKERLRQETEIERVTAVMAAEERARDQRHESAEDVALAMRRRSLEMRLARLDLDKAEEVAAAAQEQEVSNEKARIFSEQQRELIERRFEVEREEIDKALALESAKIQKDAAVIDQTRTREAAEIRRALAREQEERDREIALTAKAKELETVEIERLQITAEKEQAEHQAESVRIVADAERAKTLEQIEAEKLAEARRIDEESKAEINRMHMVTQSEARKAAAEREATAILTRAKASSDAQKVAAEGIEREAGAAGRAEMEIEGLRAANTQRQLEAEAGGLEAKADALKKYNDAASFLELTKLFIESERDIHIDQAKAMGTALQGAQIRMYGGGDGTVDTIRGMFTSGFSIGEALEGFAQSLPEGMRDRLSANGLKGLIGGPDREGAELQAQLQALDALVKRTLRTKKAKSVPLAEAIAKLEVAAGEDDAATSAVGLLKTLADRGTFADASFEQVWTVVQAATKLSA